MRTLGARLLGPPSSASAGALRFVAPPLLEGADETGMDRGKGKAASFPKISKPVAVDEEDEDDDGILRFCSAC